MSILIFNYLCAALEQGIPVRIRNSTRCCKFIYPCFHSIATVPWKDGKAGSKQNKSEDLLVHYMDQQLSGIKAG